VFERFEAVNKFLRDPQSLLKNMELRLGYALSKLPEQHPGLPI
jgi:hypothetical protein